MQNHDLLAERFEANRTNLRAVAYRMLGSASEADDAVQEAWLRLQPSRRERDRQPRRVADDGRRAGVPDMLRSRTSRREEPLAPGLPRTDRG